MAERERVNILLVDDQASRLLSYEAILGELNQNLVLARSGREALGLLMQREFAVILLDVNMPEMDGFETATMIHQHPRFESTPIIFVTAVNISDMDRLHGYKLGAVDYVYVPVVPEILRSKVSVLVELYSKRRELQELNRNLADANFDLASSNNALIAEKAKDLEKLNHALEQSNLLLREADRRKDEFLAILGHELRSPLAPLSNALAIIHSKEIVDRDVALARDMAARQLAHMTRLVDDLLDVSRITRGQIELRRVPLLLTDVIERALETSRPLIDGRRHRLSIDQSPLPLAVEADPVRLSQAISNLLNNAAKYMNEGGEILLSVRQDNDSVVIGVRDTGFGIPPAMLESIFEPFTQVAETRDKSIGGLGMGLPIVRRLIELHGGSVSGTSAGLGVGSQFEIRLPLLVGADVSDLPSPAAASRSTPALRILVVDDDRDSAVSLAMILELSGHQVMTAHDGRQAVQLAESERPDVIVLDVGMPGMNGHEAAKEIRARPWGKNIALIALTGWGQEDDRRRTAEAGFDAHRVKPVEPAEVLELIAGFSSRKPFAAN